MRLLSDRDTSERFRIPRNALTVPLPLRAISRAPSVKRSNIGAQPYGYASARPEWSSYIAPMEAVHGPLKPVQWEHHELVDERTLCLIHISSPGLTVEEAEVALSPSDIRITLYERWPPEVLPDGTPTVILAVPVAYCTRIQLPERIGRRRIVDGAAGDPSTGKHEAPLPAGRLEEIVEMFMAGRQPCPEPERLRVTSSQTR